MASDADAVRSHQDEIILEYIKEKRTLHMKLEAALAENENYKVKLYDAFKKVEESQKAVNELSAEIIVLKEKQAKSPTPPPVEPSPKAAATRPTTGRSINRTSTKPSLPALPKTPAQRRANNVQRRTTAVNAFRASTAVDNEEQLKEALARLKTIEKELAQAKERISIFEKAGRRLKDLKVATMLESERVFKESDLNNDKHIDIRELEKLLLKQGQHLLTDRQLREIIRSVDQDGNETIDIMEYLAVMEKIQQRRKTAVPDTVRATVEQSKACVIQ